MTCGPPAFEELTQALSYPNASSSWSLPEVILARPSTYQLAEQACMIGLRHIKDIYMSKASFIVQI
jgi:hypothetical protein